VVSFTFWLHLLPREKKLVFHSARDWLDPKAGLEVFGEKNIPVRAANRTPVIQPVAGHTGG